MGINEKSRNLYRPSRLTRDLSEKGRAVSRCPAHLQPTDLTRFSNEKSTSGKLGAVSRRFFHSHRLRGS
jgi:hypothetical protein